MTGSSMDLPGVGAVRASESARGNQLTIVTTIHYQKTKTTTYHIARNWKLLELIQTFVLFTITELFHPGYCQ